MKRTILAILATAIVPFVGCADQGSSTNEEPIAGSAVDNGKADGASNGTLWTYFIVTRQDMRRCVSPVCGGVYIKRLNQPQTKCADGVWAKECYVGGFDFEAIGYSDEEAVDARGRITSGQAVFRGKIATGYYPGDYGFIGAFVATEVWGAGADKAPTGTFFQAEDAGIMCITSPCPSIDAWKLNKNANPYARYAGIDFAPTGAKEDVIAKAWEALQVPSSIGGLLLAGKIVKVTGPGGKADGLKVNQFYFPMLAAKAEPQRCGGRISEPCAEGFYCQFPSQWCGMADGTGECAPKPEACDDVYAPVCGCDGVTYSNDCERQVAGAGYGTDGECKSDNACEIAGCSGELCIAAGGDNGFSVCMWREEYACYAEHGVCETQGDGGCGWTQTDALTSCLSGPVDQH